CRIVGREEANPNAALLLGQRVEELGHVARAQAEEELLGIGALEDSETVGSVGLREHEPRVAQVGEWQCRAGVFAQCGRHDQLETRSAPAYPGANTAALGELHREARED